MRVLAAGVWLASGCEERGAAPVEGSPLVNGPVAGVATSEPLPALPNGPANVEAGAMSNAFELAAPPRALDELWLRDASGDRFTTPVAFDVQLRAARDELERRLEQGKLELPGLVSDLDDAVPYIDLGDAQAQTVAYTPERARWLREFADGGALAHYEDPPAFAELRQRGARLYCAAKTAHAQQTEATQVMGKSSVGHLGVLGIDIDLLAFEPTIAMAPPMRFDSGQDDGAQAFVTPYAAGLRVRPLSFLPGLPELRAPVVFLSADSEVASTVNRQGNERYDEWITMNHVDGFGSLTHDLVRGTTGDFTIFSIGPFDIMARLSMHAGFAACSEAPDYASCRANATQQVGRLLLETREGWNGAGTPLGTPARRGGWTTPGFEQAFAYNDAPWVLNVTDWLARPENAFFPLPMRLPDPLAIRMLQNNDKSLELHTGTGIELTLSGGKQLNIGEWLRLKASVSGSFGAEASVVHRFREQQDMLLLPFEGQEDNTPRASTVTTFTVTPGVQRSLRVGTRAGLEWSIDLGFLTIDDSLDLWNVSSEQDSPREVWPENNRLRMDNAISDGEVTHLGTLSHWPRGAAFPAFDEVGCAAPSTRPEDLPPPCTTTPPPPELGDSLRGEICYYRPEWFTPPDYAGGPEQDCWDALSPWLRAGQSLPQEFRGEAVVARVLQLASEGDMQAFQAALLACESKYADAGRVEEVRQLVRFGVCDTSARLFEHFMEFGPLSAGFPSEPASCR